MKKLNHYIGEINYLLKAYARQAKIDADHPKENNKDYTQGVIMGYYSIITLLKHQAFAFCIDQKELGLADINPEVDLLGLGRNPDVEVEEDNWAIDVMHEEKLKGYLIDSITLLKEQAIEAKKEANNPKEGCEDYNKGELLAYCLFFSLLKRQASSHNIDEKELGLADIDPERDLF